MFIIQATSRYGKQTIDRARDRVEADYLAQEYQLAYGPTYRITYREAGKRKAFQEGVK